MNVLFLVMIKYAAIGALLVLALLAQPSHAQAVIPDWVKNTAGWWSEGAISESDFVLGIQYLINEGILEVPPAATAAAAAAAPPAEKSDGIPDWVKNTAGWWSEGLISDGEFISAVQHLMKTGIVTIGAGPASGEGPGGDPTLQSLQAELDACQDIPRAYQRLDCEDEVEAKIEAHHYRNNSQAYQVGPVTFYYPGMGTAGNEFFMEGDRPILTVRMLAENSGSDQNVSLSCTGPAICAYDVWDGAKAFKYSGMDFTNGQIVLKPGDSRVFNMLFGPNIGYGGTQFEYDPSRQYVFRISESWGGAQIPINIE